MEDHWPALPSIRTSNHRPSSTASSKVSCEETLNLELSRADVYNPPAETLTLMNQVGDAETLRKASHAKDDDETLNQKIWPVQLAFANPVTAVAQKLKEAGLIDKVGTEWLFLTAGEAVDYCTSQLRVTAL